jgi:5-methylthioribose kinase
MPNGCAARAGQTAETPGNRRKRDMASIYAPVDGAKLSSILAGLPDLSARLGGEPADWRVREVGDGNLNLVFIVEGPAGGLVVKQALPYVRLVGESWPLPLERSWFEYNALVEQARYAARLTPKVFHFDREQAMIVMEYLSPHIIMRKGLIRGIEYPRFAADIAEFLAATLFNTSVLAGTAAEHKRRVELFARNTELCRITEDLVFTDPYREAPLNQWNRPHLDADKRAFETDSALKVAAQARKYQFLTAAQALIHGDLHTGSIMLTTGDTRIIDPEFAFVGPIGFDVGAVIGNLLLAYLAQEGHEAAPHARDAYRVWILDQVVAVWTGFHDRFLALWRQASAGEAYVAGLFTSPLDEAALEGERRRFLRSLFEDTLAFGGLKMIRRILGLAHVEDLESIADPARRAICERKALRLGRALVLGGAKFSSVADVIEAARQTESR